MADFTAVVALTSLDGTTGTQFTGEAAANYAGQSISNVGDINGDGIDDFAIGATGVGGASQGAVYIVFGTASGFPATWSLSTLNGTNGFQVNGGEYAQDFVGVSVAGGGDINNDGIDDLIIGASGADPDGGGSGAAYVLYGKNVAVDGAFASDIATSSLNGTTGFQISGTNAGDGLGFNVAMGDFNGDGIEDLLVGANQADFYRGAGYVIFGKDTGVNGAFAGEINVATLDGTNGFKMPAGNVYDYTGTSVSNAGDVNGDGIDDIAIGGMGADPNGSNSGAVYIVFGKSTGFTASVSLTGLNGTDGFRIAGLAAGDQLGISVSGVGDVNEDGIDDVLVGANGLTNNGGAFVVFGKNTAVDGAFASNLNVSSLNGTNGYRIDGELAGDNLGIRVSGTGDVNGDGVNDFIIGATGKDDTGSNSGAAYVIFGGSTVGSTGTVSLAGLDGTNGFQINGEAAGDNLSRVAGWGDWNNDGVMDILVATSFNDAGGNNSGSGWIIYGLPGSNVLATTPGDDDLTGTAGVDTGDGGDGEDILRGGGGDDILSGGAENDQLYGDADNDTLDGGAGGDLLDGGTGADSMSGGIGNDTYVVDDIGDVVNEGAGEGNDRVRASISFTLSANLENLQLTGSADINGTGNASANQIDGNSGANVLNGGGGNDIIRGNAGGDDLSGDTGSDQLLGGDGDDTIYGGDANDILQGNADSDTLYGGAGVDSLDGGTENDFLYGEAGNDKLLGGDGDDQLFGGADNDQLTGGAGLDTLAGGTGDDTYFIDDYTDTLVEAVGEGNDIVRATVSWALGDNFERLILEGSGDINGFGNALANQINGNSGANVLDGGDGADVLNGGLGNDLLIGGVGNDTMVGGGGADVFVIEQESVFTSSDPLGRTIETDTVTDYVVGQDSLDFSFVDAIGGGADDAFSIVGAFNGNAGQMTVTFAGGITTVLLDVDGDAKADYRLRINGDVSGDTASWIL